MPIFKDIDDWRVWNDNRYIDASGQEGTEEDDEDEDEECD